MVIRHGDDKILGSLQRPGIGARGLVILLPRKKMQLTGINFAKPFRMNKRELTVLYYGKKH